MINPFIEEPFFRLSMRAENLTIQIHLPTFSETVFKRVSYDGKWEVKVNHPTLTQTVTVSTKFVCCPANSRKIVEKATVKNSL